MNLLFKKKNYVFLTILEKNYFQFIEASRHLKFIEIYSEILFKQEDSKFVNIPYFKSKFVKDILALDNLTKTNKNVEQNLDLEMFIKIKKILCFLGFIKFKSIFLLENLFKIINTCSSQEFYRLLKNFKISDLSLSIEKKSLEKLFIQFLDREDLEISGLSMYDIENYVLFLKEIILQNNLLMKDDLILKKLIDKINRIFSNEKLIDYNDLKFFELKINIISVNNKIWKQNFDYINNIYKIDSYNENGLKKIFCLMRYIKDNNFDHIPLDVYKKILNFEYRNKKLIEHMNLKEIYYFALETSSLLATQQNYTNLLTFEDINLLKFEYLTVKNLENKNNLLKNYLADNLHLIDKKSLFFIISLEMLNLYNFGKYIPLIFIYYKMRLVNDEKNLKDIIFFLEHISKISNEKKFSIYLKNYQNLFNLIIESENDFVSMISKIFKIISIGGAGLYFLDNYELNGVIDEGIMRTIDLKNSEYLLYPHVGKIFSANNLKLFRFENSYLNLISHKFKKLYFHFKVLHLRCLFQKIAIIKYYDLFQILFNSINIEMIDSLNQQTIFAVANLFDYLITFDLIDMLNENFTNRIFSNLEKMIENEEKEFFYMYLVTYLKICKKLYPHIYQKIPINIINKTHNKIKKNYIDLKQNSNRFHNNFKFDLLKIFPKIKYQENFHLFDKDFECDFFLTENKILIEFLGPSHFLSSDLFQIHPETNIILKLKKFILKPNKICLVPYYEWINLNDDKEKINYIKKITEI